MKVVHINEHLALKGGVETYLLNLLPLMRDSGIDQSVIYASGDESLWGRSKRLAEVAATGFASDASAYKAATALLTDLDPDVIHVHGIQNVGVLKACLDAAPTMMTTHDYRLICPASTFFYKRTQEVCQRQCGPGCFSTTLTKHCLTLRPSYAAYYYYRSRWVIRHAARFAHIIAPCADALERYARAGFAEDRISVMPYFCPMRPEKEPRPVPEKTTITYIGRLAPNKGHEYFLRALGALPDSVQGIMVGNFSESSKKHTIEEAERSGCAHRLSVHAWSTQEKIIQILDDTSVLIFPSLWPETLGIVGLEAFSRGVPVVASRIGGVPEWLNDGKNGFMVDPKSPGQIRDAVLKLVEDRSALIEFGKEALRTINRKFLPERHVSALTDVYLSAINPQPVIPNTHA